MQQNLRRYKRGIFVKAFGRHQPFGMINVYRHPVFLNIILFKNIPNAFQCDITDHSLHQPEISTYSLYMSKRIHRAIISIYIYFIPLTMFKTYKTHLNKMILLCKTHIHMQQPPNSSKICYFSAIKAWNLKSTQTFLATAYLFIVKSVLLL